MPEMSLMGLPPPVLVRVERLSRHFTGSADSERNPLGPLLAEQVVGAR
jgi:hypothetical protein